MFNRPPHEKTHKPPNHTHTHTHRLISWVCLCLGGCLQCLAKMSTVVAWLMRVSEGESDRPGGRGKKRLKKREHNNSFFNE